MFIWAGRGAGRRRKTRYQVRSSPDCQTWAGCFLRPTEFSFACVPLSSVLVQATLGPCGTEAQSGELICPVRLKRVWNQNPAYLAALWRC